MLVELLVRNLRQATHARLNRTKLKQLYLKMSLLSIVSFNVPQPATYIYVLAVLV